LMMRLTITADSVNLIAAPAIAIDYWPISVISAREYQADTE
jgi:hypothetical protein